MTVKNIIKQVRWSLDEESGSTDFVDTYLDNIIKAKMYDALRWVNLYADASLLNDSASSGTGGSIKEETSKSISSGGMITLDSNFVRLIRVRATSWKKAVSTLIEEDSDEYVMQSDENYPEAKATNERPVVALIRTVPNKLQLFPFTTGDTAEITYVMMPSSDDTTSLTGDSTIPVPSKLITAYIYYICYLVMIAYNDTTKAANMLATAKMNVAASDKK